MRARIVEKATGRTLWAMIVPHNWSRGAAERMALYWFAEHCKHHRILMPPINTVEVLP